MIPRTMPAQGLSIAVQNADGETDVVPVQDIAIMPENATPDNAPLALGKGKYAIYQQADGSGVLAYRPDHMDEDQHQVIPAPVFRLLLKALSGEPFEFNPMEIMKMMMGA